MSSFNKPFKTDKELEVEAIEKRRRRNLKQRQDRNTLADQIFHAVLEQVEAGKNDFSKKEMIELVAGTRTISPAEKIAWNVACTVAIRKIRNYYWNEGYRGDDNRAFNYIDGRYWLISVDDKLKTNIMYDRYDKKMKGIAKHQKGVAISAYSKVLELNDSERQELITKMKAQGLIENGEK